MAMGNSPVCSEIRSEHPYWQESRLILPFLIDGWQHYYQIDFPSELGNLSDQSSTILLGIAMAEIYRLSEICTPKVISIPWYRCQSWERDWWQDDMFWYLQQKFYLEQWDWSQIPHLEFSTTIDSSSSWTATVNDSYLLAVSGGKESTFAFEWMKRAELPLETFTLHHAGGILGHHWQSKFPVFDDIKKRSPFWEVLAHPRECPAEHFAYDGVRNDPTITNALFVMMIIATQRQQKFIVLANDKSSNEANVVHQGRSVNHQSAKGNEYIRRFNDFLSRKGLPFRYISICEESYSIAAVEQLARWNQNSLKELTCCNEAQWSLDAERWCCNCPKCAFSYALIEASTSRNFAIGAVGKDLLSQHNLREVWQRLYDPEQEKPFECVGEKYETLMALVRCKERRVKNGEPLGALDLIPDSEFDLALLQTCAPSNIPMAHQNRLNSILV